MKRDLVILAAALALAMAAGCGGSKPAPESDSGVSAPVARTAPVSTNKADYPVFPDADSGADPSVPAEQGGKGFTGKGWETNTDFDLIGDPQAVKGGMIRFVLSDFPSTLRPHGPNITTFNQMVSNLVYESLLGMHPTTLEYYPQLASHWQISPDKSTYRFRIDPNARFADGTPVTADDVVASWSFWMDKTISDPYLLVTFGKFEKPVAESKYIVRVKALKPNWLNFINFSTQLQVLPAHVLKTTDGASWIRDFNYKMVPGSGPYAIADSDVQKGSTVAIRRRHDYWADNSRRNIGTNNFDEIRIMVVRDRNLEFEMFKKGDLDFYYVNRAQMWQEDLGFADVNRGLIQKRRIWNHYPNGTQGIVLNTRRAPYDDLRVRKALAFLYNREEMIAKLMYGAYEPVNSNFPGSIWENPDDDKVTYDPQAAVKLLADAGYTGHDAQGDLTRDGVPLKVEILYPDQEAERFLTVYQEDLRKVGITLNLRLVTYETMVKLVDDRDFGMVDLGYSADLFPDPGTVWLSELADEKDSNNVSGFKNAKVDQLIAQYDTTYDIPTRVKLIREMDKLITDAHTWIFEWYAPNQRMVFWNRYGMPKGELTRIGDFTDLLSLWWIDPAKEAKLEQAKRDPSINLGQGEVEDKYWLDFEKKEEH